MTSLKVGDKAPVFEGVNQNGEKISLKDYAGKKLILYFYPKDNTPGCTAESCNLNDNYEAWLQKGFDVVGVSPDSQKSHQNFIAKFGFRFNLISDTEHEILEAYGAWGLKKMYGKEYMGVLRKTFVIDENGVISEIFEKVDTKDHSNQIIEALKL
ncbi:thioredoxin-dependent thiol peroxidase [Maribellus sediminis]|uniref:thioredoxin-dependent thiol peroxidase n=1 Tax=Maribellus sediminis TaxID=2696285 RepID=UPI00143028E0|nr:thioredoxin-dependent thiol peroxidase [Maribellus sediminis]